MMLHVTGRGFIAQQPHTRRRATNGVTSPVGVGSLGMTTQEAMQLLITGNGTPDQLKQANLIYYGPPSANGGGGVYGQDASVIAAHTGGGVGTSGGVMPVPPYPGNSEPIPNLYAMENCDPMDGACIGRNAQREAANQVLTNNARTKYNKDICEYNYALNVNQVGDAAQVGYTCGQYQQQQVPPAPGQPTTPVTMGGQVLAAVSGQNPGTVVSGQTPSYTPGVQNTTVAVPNNQVQASTATGKPNQSVPPNPSPGTVPIVPVPTAAQTLATSSVNGVAPVVDNTTTGDPFGLGITGTLFGLPEWQVLLAGLAVGGYLLMRKA